MTKEERMAKSESARAHRKEVKSIKKKVTAKFYAHMRHLREKYNKIKNRHHDRKID
jgi:hypothetical protein|tara:strand:+ start:9216 stop:9383 length:168 start_codon:yes stop_codon:yes gene_type:complete